jgi:D-beta-D-heptose 7-phosphate kinase/D-beta-D-heptose 1-phosphate adenosyltransferase
MKNLDHARLKKIIKNFNKTSLLVIGDVMLDEFIQGKVDRISPEAPVPVVRVIRADAAEWVMPGGASNVAHNIRAFGGEVYIAGIIGNDSKGGLLLRELKKRNINVDGVVRDSKRPTTLKTRVMSHHRHQQVVRIDREITDDISDNIIKQILMFTRKIIENIDAVIIEDYGKGVIVPQLVENLTRLVKKHKKIITVDPKESHFSLYKNVTAITPNHYEAARAIGVQVRDDMPIEDIGRKLLKQLNSEVALITLGEDGMCLFEKSGKIVRIPTVAQDVYDVSGAGDTVISAYTLAMASGARNIEAAHIANCAAGIVVGKVGIAVATQEELLDKIKREIGQDKKKVKVKVEIKDPQLQLKPAAFDNNVVVQRKVRK